MYRNNGQQVLHTDRVTGVNTHIADARDAEAAHALTTAMNERSPNFIRDAMVTCSPMFHGDMVAHAQWKGRLNGAIDALTKLDQVKKSLFYGRDNNLIADGQSDVSDLPNNMGGNDQALVRAVAINVIHAILGIATEAGELLEALRDGLNGKPFDWVNIKEEAGDLAWYEALLANSGDYTFEEVQQLIIRKLKTRFADKFSAAEANTRNLDAERQVLEAGTTTYDPRTAETRSPEGSGAPMPDFGGDGEIEPHKVYPPLQDEGDLIAGEPLIVPSTPASGKAAVEVAEAEANQAFSNVGSVPPKVEPEIEGSDELAKSPAERLHPLPGEATAQQNARGIPETE